MNITNIIKKPFSRLFNWDQKDDKNKNDQGPPNLDEIFKKLQQQLNNIFGNKKPGGPSNINWGGSSSQGGAGFLIGIIVVVLIFMIGIMGFYKVNPGEEAAVFRFGKYVETKGPGPHWIFPFIHKTEIINTSAVNQKSFEDELITKNVNIILLSLVVQYKIGNLHNYLFNVKDPIESLSEATRSAIRHVIADSTLDEVLTTNSSGGQLGEKIYKYLLTILKSYNTGLDIRGIEIISVQPPEAVKSAFNDAIQAQEDEVKYQNQAEAYSLKVLPRAEGDAIAYIEEAKAYATQVVFEAEGEVSKFNALLPEYKKSPDVTRSRIYLSTMQEILDKTPKVFIDSNSSNNMLYIPWDKLSNQIMNNNKSLLKDFVSTGNRQMDILDKQGETEKSTANSNMSNYSNPNVNSYSRNSKRESSSSNGTWGTRNSNLTNSGWDNAG